MVKLWGESSIKSTYNPQIKHLIPGMSFSKEKKFFNPTDDKNKTTAMFYGSDAETGFEQNPDKIKAFSIPIAGAGFALKQMGPLIDNSRPGPGYYVVREA